MNARRWLAAEILNELETSHRLDEAEEPWLDDTLAAALAESGLTDRSIDLLTEMVASAPQPTREYEPHVLADIPPLATRREALGISVTEAARQLGVGEAMLAVFEQAPLRWLNLDANRVANYLARLGISPAVFVRWQATLLPAGPRFDWGYRPGAVVDRPVGASGTTERERLLDWGRDLLAVDAHPLEQHGERELLGHRWSATVSKERSRQIADTARARILETPLRYEGGSSEAKQSLIALPTARGVGYPAFQFDEHGRTIPIVAEINSLLGAENDPWGVADWWLTGDSTLGARPVDVIDRGPASHARLRAVAQRLLETE